MQEVADMDLSGLHNLSVRNANQHEDEGTHKMEAFFNLKEARTGSRKNIKSS